MGSGWYWHNGETGGYTSFASFDPSQDLAVVVPSNTVSPPGRQARMHILPRLAGEPAVWLAPPHP